MLSTLLKNTKRITNYLGCACIVTLFSTQAFADGLPSQEDRVFMHEQTPQNASDSLAKILESIQKNQVQQGQFEQQRWLAVLDKPLISKGEFSVIKNKELNWNITAPFAIHYQFDGKQLKQTEFSETHTIGLRDDPMLYGFFSFFFDLLNGKHEALESYFSIESTAREHTLQHITLKPEKAQLKKAFSLLHIAIEGTTLKQVEIIENAKDKVVLNFNYHALDK